MSWWCADADEITISQGGGGANSLVLHLHSVGRAQIDDHEAGPGVDNYGMVAAHIGAIKHDVFIGQAPDPGSRPHQRIAAPGVLPQAGSNGVAADRAALAQGGGRARGGVLGGLFDVQRFLAQDPRMQGSHRGAGVDAEIVGERGFQTAVGIQGVGLTFRQIVGGDQLRPQRLTIRMLDGQRFQVVDDGMATPARDFGLCPGGVRHYFVLHQRGRERIHERKVA